MTAHLNLIKSSIGFLPQSELEEFQQWLKDLIDVRSQMDALRTREEALRPQAVVEASSTSDDDEDEIVTLASLANSSDEDKPKKTKRNLRKKAKKAKRRSNKAFRCMLRAEYGSYCSNEACP